MDLKKKTKSEKNCDSCDLIFGFKKKNVTSVMSLKTITNLNSFFKKIVCVSYLAYLKVYTLKIRAGI